jgi:hypothetical protein
MTQKNDLPKVRPDHTMKYFWDPEDVVIHKAQGVGKKPPQDPKKRSTDQLPSGDQSTTTPKGG